MQKTSLSVRRLLKDRSGLAAVEFAMIFPMMVVMFFGVLELSAAISVDRKATLVARTLSDLTSQMVSVANADLVSFGEAAKAIMTPYRVRR
jgi:Flp pilus assembly protein TadG